jgi:NAD(P)-dependent dehydrogenase (short-subunit alcohol dehydrogenase family)
MTMPPRRSGSSRRRGGAPSTIAGDVGDKAFCDRAVAETVEKLGRLDTSSTNAAEQHPDDDIRDITEEQLRRTFQTNIFGYFYKVQAARPALGKGAAIVNCTSVTMYKGSANLLDYAATKGAITAFTRSLSENLIEGGHSRQRGRARARSGLP